MFIYNSESILGFGLTYLKYIFILFYRQIFLISSLIELKFKSINVFKYIVIRNGGNTF